MRLANSKAGSMMVEIWYEFLCAFLYAFAHSLTQRYALLKNIIVHFLSVSPCVFVCSIEQLMMEVDIARGRLGFVLNGTPLSSVEVQVADGVYVYASMDGFNNLFPRTTVEKVEKLR
jgi:hypothetical protein